MATRPKTAALKKTDPTMGLPPLNDHAAGIDVGSAEHWVAVPPGSDPEPVRCFGSFTADLHRLADWLTTCGGKTVALESTGIYWIALFQVLEARGFAVHLVDARRAKSLPGRKRDLLDCQWLQKLHTFGLLKRCFRPTEEVCVLRSYLRQRENLVAAATISIPHMQKALAEMNVQLTNVISDLTGTTGLAIIRAILQGERAPNRLAERRDCRIQASQEEIAQSFVGTWREELLFVLRQALELYEVYQQKIAACDAQVEAHLKGLPSKTAEDAPLPPPKRNQKPRKSAPQFDLRGQLYRVSGGVDLTGIDGINVLTAQTLLSEIGLDMSAWPTEKHFASWLGLCPDHRISGGKILKRGTRQVINRAATAFRLAASTLRNSKSALGANFRRLRTRLGAPKAITAMAHKLARLVYRMLKYGKEYVHKGMEHYEARYREQQSKWLTKQAQELKLQVIPA
jgi:transposase